MIVRFEEIGTFAMKPERGCIPSRMQKAEETANLVLEQAKINAYGSSNACTISRHLYILYSIVCRGLRNI